MPITQEDWDKGTPITQQGEGGGQPYLAPSTGGITQEAWDSGTIVPFEQSKNNYSPPNETLVGSLAQRGQNIVNAVTASQDLNAPPLRRPLRVAGEMAGAVGDIAGAALNKGIETFVPKDFRDTWKSGLSDVVNNGVVKMGLDAVRQGVEYYNLFKQRYPEVAKDFESVFNIATLLPVGEGRAVAKGLSNISGAAANVIEKSISKQASREALDIVSKDLGVMSRAEKRTAIKMGQVEEAGTFRKASVIPTPQEIEMASVIKDVVNSKNSPMQNVDNIRKKIAKVGEETKTLPRELDTEINQSVWNRDGVIRNVLNQEKEKSSVIFASDKTLENAYDSVVDKFMEIVSTKPNTLSSVLEARKEFDNVIRDKFPNLFDKISGDNVRANAVRDVRSAANNFVANLLPEGNQFRQLLQDQTNMYRAIDRIAEKAAPKLDQSTIQKIGGVISRHPWLAAEASLGALGVATGMGSHILHILTNPVALSAIFLYGAYKTGRTVVTSQSLKNTLSGLLRAGTGSFSPNEIATINTLVNNLGQRKMASMQSEKMTAPLPNQQLYNTKE